MLFLPCLKNCYIFQGYEDIGLCFLLNFSLSLPLRNVVHLIFVYGISWYQYLFFSLKDI